VSLQMVLLNMVLAQTGFFLARIRFARPPCGFMALMSMEDETPDDFGEGKSSFLVEALRLKEMTDLAEEK